MRTESKDLSAANIYGDAKRLLDSRFSSYRQPSPRGEGSERSEPDRVLAA